MIVYIQVSWFLRWLQANSEEHVDMDNIVQLEDLRNAFPSPDHEDIQESVDERTDASDSEPLALRVKLSAQMALLVYIPQRDIYKANQLPAWDLGSSMTRMLRSGVNASK